MGRSRVVAVIAASLLLVTGCGDDDEEASSSPSPTPSAEASGPAGYAFDVPEGWKDVTKSFEGTAIKVDRAYAGKPVDGFATNIVVIVETPRGEIALDAVMEEFRGQAEAQATDAGVSESEDRELGGEPARTYTFRRRDDPSVRQRQVVAVVDGAIYTLTLSAATTSFEDQEPVFDGILDSWSWDEGETS